MPDCRASAKTEGPGDRLPAGYTLVQVKTTYLEMLENSVRDRPAAPAGCELRLWRKPPSGQYRELFTAVGGGWGWSGRLLLSDGELRAVLDDDAIEVWRLHEGSAVAGFIELDWRVPGEVEIVYFGLRPEFIGRGLGTFALRSAIHHAWAGRETGGATCPTRRIWLHTCDLDSPTALPFYLKAGFVIFDEQTGPEAYPADHAARVGRGTESLESTQPQAPLGPERPKEHLPGQQ